MQVIKFEQKDAVGHIVLANPPKNLIASAFSNSLKQAVAGSQRGRHQGIAGEGGRPQFQPGWRCSRLPGEEYQSVPDLHCRMQPVVPRHRGPADPDGRCRSWCCVWWRL